MRGHPVNPVQHDSNHITGLTGISLYFLAIMMKRNEIFIFIQISYYLIVFWIIVDHIIEIFIFIPIGYYLIVFWIIADHIIEMWSEFLGQIIIVIDIIKTKGTYAFREVNPVILLACWFPWPQHLNQHTDPLLLTIGRHSYF